MPPTASGALCLPTPDWLAHRLVVAGPRAEVAVFRAAAAGSGGIPWHLRPSELEEGWFGQLVALSPAQRGISVEGAHVLSGQLATAVQAWRAGEDAPGPESHAVPLDLHALVPVPQELLLLGPQAPEAEAWLWAHWGTTWPLRGVLEETPAPAERQRLPEGQEIARYRFHSADWSPWQALVRLRLRWPGLRLDLMPEYGLADPAAPARQRQRRRRDGPG